MLNIMNKDKNYARYKIGKYTYGSPKVESWKINCGTLGIGSFTSIARGVTIFLGGDHHTEWITTAALAHFFNYDGKDSVYSQVKTKGDVIIGNDVWIGTEATILSGVTIGDGAIIGARSVVSKDVPPYCVAVGNPCRVVKKRFSDYQINKLLEIKWWDWDENKVNDNIRLLCQPNIDEFITTHKQN